MLKIEKGAVSFSGSDMDFTLEIVAGLCAYYSHMKECHGEEMANELFATVGRMAVDETVSDGMITIQDKSL